MSLAKTYVIASKVRVKLAKQASDPKSSLRLLVLQANMLDRLIDDVTVSGQKLAAKSQSKVLFGIPHQKREEPVFDRSCGPSITEYEVDSDSDDYSFSSSDSEENAFGQEDDEEFSDIEDEVIKGNRLKCTSPRGFPTLHHSDKGDSQLLIVFEENEEEIPELHILNSTSSDSDSEEELSMSNYVLWRTSSPYHVKLMKTQYANVSVENIIFHPQHADPAYAIAKVY